MKLTTRGVCSELDHLQAQRQLAQPPHREQRVVSVASLGDDDGDGEWMICFDWSQKSVAGRIG